MKEKSIPIGLVRKEIFDQYWKEKIQTRGGRLLESSVYTVVEKLYEVKKTELYENEVVKLIGTSSYTALLSEQVILYTFLDQMLDQNIVGFVYEAFLEYAMARYLRLHWNWIGANPETI